jgi:hypothetical protein
MALGMSTSTSQPAASHRFAHCLSCMLSRVPAVLIGSVVVDQDRERLDASQDRKLFDVTRIDQRPNGLQQRPAILHRGGGEACLGAFADDEADGHTIVGPELDCAVCGRAERHAADLLGGRGERGADDRLRLVRHHVADQRQQARMELTGTEDAARVKAQHVVNIRRKAGYATMVGQIFSDQRACNRLSLTPPLKCASLPSRSWLWNSSLHARR